MTDQPTTPATTPTDAPASKAGGEQSQSQPQVNWEARYNGLNATYGKLQKKYDDLQVQYNQLNAETEEHKQTVKKADGEKATLSSDLQKLQAENAALQTQVKASVFNGERMKLIMGEYPELAGFEAEGLLPAADTVETLKPKLDAFKAKLGGNIQAGVQKKLQGNGPAQSGRNETPAGGHSEDYIYARLNQLAGHRTPEQEQEYSSLRDEWDALHSK